MASRSLPCFSFAWEHGNHLPPKLAITESSRLSFVHVLVVVRDCQVDSITNRAMPCRVWMSINDVDQRRRSTTTSINDVDQRRCSTMSINDVDQRRRSTTSINDVDQRRRSTTSINNVDVDHRRRSSIIDHRSSMIDHR